MQLFSLYIIFVFTTIYESLSDAQRHQRRLHAYHHRQYNRIAFSNDEPTSLTRAERQTTLPSLLPMELAQKLLVTQSSDNDPLYVLFTGDPQYHYECIKNNVDCKRRSAGCHQHNSTTKSMSTAEKNPINFVDFAAEITSHSSKHCAIIESTFANEVQRKSIFNLNRRLSAANISVVALVVNGDLTQHGHAHQLELFKTEWLSLPIAVFVGLGNHDYDNNVDDCFNNHCADRMLNWFTNEYAPKQGLLLDHTTSNHLWKVEHHGSLAYSVNFCSRTRTNCVHHIQLHNRVDYARQINAVNTLWDIRAPLSWLAADLYASTKLNASWPVLINVHNNHDSVSAKRLRSVLQQWLKRPENAGQMRRVMVLFAHMHDEHGLTTQCIANITIPFIYVGSVPNNRYTLVKFSNNVASVFMLRANADATTSILRIHDHRWTSC